VYQMRNVSLSAGAIGSLPFAFFAPLGTNHMALLKLLAA
jgi:hypothetical protein